MAFYSRNEPASNTANEIWLLQARYCESETMVVGNGTTNFGQVKSGTPMGKITSSGKIRPCAKVTVNGAQSSVNELEMASVEHFYVGDVVTVYDVSGDTTIATTRSITAKDAASSPPTITISGAAVTTQAGDYVFVEDGSATCIGFLVETVTTVEPSPDSDGATNETDQPCVVLVDGVVDESELIALDALVKTDLTGDAETNITFR